MNVPNILNRRFSYRAAFGDLKVAQQRLRDLAESDAAHALGVRYVDGKSPWHSWSVTPVFDGTELTALDFHGTVQDDRGAPSKSTVRVPFEDPNGPLKEEQRRALFATFHEVFGDSDRPKRLAFTRMVLGKTTSEPVTWSANKPGHLTIAEASKLLDALDALNV